MFVRLRLYWLPPLQHKLYFHKQHYQVYLNRKKSTKNNVFLPGRREHVVINECLLNNYKISNTKEEQHGGVE